MAGIHENLESSSGFYSLVPSRAQQIPLLKQTNQKHNQTKLLHLYKTPPTLRSQRKHKIYMF